MFFEITFIMAQPKRADARRERAVSGTNGRRSVLCGAVGQIRCQPNRQKRKNPPYFGFDNHRHRVSFVVIQKRAGLPGAPVKGPGELVRTVVKKPLDRKLDDGRAALSAFDSQ